jgi:hypothetical protein
MLAEEPPSPRKLTYLKSGPPGGVPPFINSMVSAPEGSFLKTPDILSVGFTGSMRAALK